MRRAALTAIMVTAVWVPVATADGICTPNGGLKDGCYVSEQRHHSRGLYPPTYVVDGRVFFYYPGEGRPDEPAHLYAPPPYRRGHFDRLGYLFDW